MVTPAAWSAARHSSWLVVAMRSVDGATAVPAPSATGDATIVPPPRRAKTAPFCNPIVRGWSACDYPEPAELGGAAPQASGGPRQVDDPRDPRLARADECRTPQSRSLP